MGNVDDGKEEKVIQFTGQIQLPACSLIGWMNADEAVLWLAGRIENNKDRPEYTERAERARSTVAFRRSSLDQTGIVSPAPNELSGYVDELRQQGSSAELLNQGWRVEIVDLSRVVAFQPHIHTDQAVERVKDVDPTDVVSLARVSLPLPGKTTFPLCFDVAKQAWIFSSTNPNLRIARQFQAPMPVGLAVGFLIRESNSYVQVVSYRGRHILHDGYHRAYGFLKRGISLVPALVREIATFSELGVPAGSLPQEAFLGDCPPTLKDYHDDEVSADITMPATQKVVVIQGLEFSTLSS